MSAGVNGAPPGRPASADHAVTLGGRAYTLRYSIKAMVALQDHFGLRSVSEVGRRLVDAEAFGALDVVAVVHAGLRTHHPDVTVEALTDLLDEIGLDATQAAIGMAFAAATPDAPAGGGDAGGDAGGEAAGDGEAGPTTPGPSTG